MAGVEQGHNLTIHGNGHPSRVCRLSVGIDLGIGETFVGVARVEVLPVRLRENEVASGRDYIAPPEIEVRTVCHRDGDVVDCNGNGLVVDDPDGARVFVIGAVVANEHRIRRTGPRAREKRIRSQVIGVSHLNRKAWWLLERAEQVGDDLGREVVRGGVVVAWAAEEVQNIVRVVNRRAFGGGWCEVSRVEEVNALGSLEIERRVIGIRALVALVQEGTRVSEERVIRAAVVGEAGLDYRAPPAGMVPTLNESGAAPGGLILRTPLVMSVPLVFSMTKTAPSRLSARPKLLAAL